MSVLGGFLRAAISWCRPAGALVSSARTFYTGSRCSNKIPGVPERKNVDRWTEKRSMFGVYDNIGILGDFKAHPKDLIIGPSWLKGFRGNELQRCMRKKKLVGNRMMTKDRHDLEKRIKFLYRRYNRYGKFR
ncbi:large ribosomal subunit protein mL51 [Neosynchiropus ocellatus]